MCLAVVNRALALILRLGPEPQTKGNCGLLVPEGHPDLAAQHPQTWGLWESWSLLVIVP